MMDSVERTEYNVWSELKEIDQENSQNKDAQIANCLAKEATAVLLFGKKLTAHEALKYGLISQVVKDDELPRTAEKMLENFSNLPTESLRVNKKLLRDVHRDALTETNKEECLTIIRRWHSEEFVQAAATSATHQKQDKQF